METSYPARDRIEYIIAFINEAAIKTLHKL